MFWLFYPFLTKIPILQPLKTPEKSQRFSTLAKNGLITTTFKQKFYELQNFAKNAVMS